MPYIDWSGREQEDPEGDAMREPRSETRYDLWTQEGGCITGYCWTNDNLDLGYPSEEARWEERYTSLAHAMKRTGGTHQGIGSFVSVYLDGELVDPEGKPCASDGHQVVSDLALMLAERESERRAEAHEAPGVSQGNWEDNHRPYWRS